MYELEEGSHGCLIVVWSDGIHRYLLDEYPSDGVVAGGSFLKPYHPGKYLFLYDWLRQPDGQVCGVRFGTGTAATPVAQWLASRSGVRVREHLIFDIPLLEFSVEPFYADDEQFVGHDALQATDGSFALAFELLGITETDAHRLAASGVKV